MGFLDRINRMFSPDLRMIRTAFYTLAIPESAGGYGCRVISESVDSDGAEMTFANESVRIRVRVDREHGVTVRLRSAGAGDDAPWLDFDDLLRARDRQALTEVYALMNEGAPARLMVNRYAALLREHARRMLLGREPVGTGG